MGQTDWESMSAELISVLIAVLAIGRSAVRADPDQQSRTAGGHGPDGCEKT